MVSRSFFVIFDAALQPEVLQTGKTTIVGVQNELPPNVPLLHEDHFELKVIKTLQVQEKLLPLP